MKIHVFIINRSSKQHEEEDFDETKEIGELKIYQVGIVNFDGSCNSYQKQSDTFVIKKRFEGLDVFCSPQNYLGYP